MNKLAIGRVGVLAGGPSSERAISLKSGRAVFDALISENIDALFLDVGEDVRDVIKNNKIDVAFIALHGTFGEDGTVQQALEDLRIPYTGSGPKASRLAMDKAASKEIFIKSNIAVPGHIMLNKNNYNAEDACSVGFPLVVKPKMEGSSIGLSVVRERSLLEKAVDEAFRYGPDILIEEYIAGRELTVGILDDEPLPVIEIVTKNNVYDYKAKYDDPDTRYLVPAPVEKDIFEKAKAIGLESHIALGCKCFSRVDMMMAQDGKIFVLEVNTIPGMTQRSLLPKAAQAKGLNFGQLCIKLLENAIRGERVV